MFQAVKTVFARNPDVVASNVPKIQKARQLITKIVNVLTGKSEIGGPMACLYLLGHYDHYKSHKFKTCYWRLYLREVYKSWPEYSNPIDVKENVVIQKAKEKLVGVSNIMDYIHRPARFENITLYDWIRRAEKVVKNKKNSDGPKRKYQDLPKQYTDSIYIGDDSDLAEKVDANQLDVDSEPVTDWELFSPEHPQCETHVVRLLAGKDSYVPNFIGGSLPRKDSGNREDYCATMLMFFKPWRNGKELKEESRSWDYSFKEYPFSERQEQLMKFFHVRYECNDARDDYSAQKKAGLLQAKFAMQLDDEYEIRDYFFGDDADLQEIQRDIDILEQQNHLDIKTGKMQDKERWALQMANILHRLGIVKSTTGPIKPMPFTEREDGNAHPSSVWKAMLTKLRDRILQKRQELAAQKTANSNQNLQNHAVDEVKIVNKSLRFLSETKKNRSCLKTGAATVSGQKKVPKPWENSLY
ncbi:hypothetical protein BXZ70DRAFT_900372 [Cristinia sonorae]|uniref:Uncharacterized protein n=1 Tax=Cristinia sonorae TaxID=1940300 RepID=A0A8K0UHM4_9AGAR|nr:hypothetical protein BXZ70DRAFT_900372 [Cristinia sonorae]